MSVSIDQVSSDLWSVKLSTEKGEIVLHILDRSGGDEMKKNIVELRKMLLPTNGLKTYVLDSVTVQCMSPKEY